jgi:hypothetical protein
MLVRRAELEQRAAHQTLRRTALEAELAVQAKRLGDAESTAGNSLAMRVAAEHEAVELAEYQARSEAAAALAAAARCDAERQYAQISASRARIEIEQRAAAEAMLCAEREAEVAAADRMAAVIAAEEAARLRAHADREIAETTQQTLEYDAEARRIACERIEAAMLEQQANAERIEIERKLFGKAKAGSAEALAILRTAQAVLGMRSEQRMNRRWFMAGAGAFALVVALLVPQAFWQQGIDGIADRVGFAEDLQPVNLVSARAFPAILTMTEPRLEGMKMSDRLSRPPKKAR